VPSLAGPASCRSPSYENCVKTPRRPVVFLFKGALPPASRGGPAASLDFRIARVSLKNRDLHLGEEGLWWAKSRVGFFFERSNSSWRMRQGRSCRGARVASACTTEPFVCRIRRRPKFPEGETNLVRSDSVGRGRAVGGVAAVSPLTRGIWQALW